MREQLILILSLGYAVSSQAGSCEVPSFDPNPRTNQPQLGTSTLYVYTFLNVTSPCSGAIRSFKLCYEMTSPPTSTAVEAREIATMLILDRAGLTVREVIPIRVNINQCETQEIQQPGCCVTRPVNSTLQLQALRGNTLDFAFALRTPTSYELLRLRFGGYTNSGVEGFLLQPESQYTEGDVIPQHNAISVTVGLVSFNVSMPAIFTATSTTGAVDGPTAFTPSHPKGTPVDSASTDHTPSAPTTEPSGTVTAASTDHTPSAPTTYPASTVTAAASEGNPVVLRVSSYINGLVGLGIISLLLLVISTALAIITVYLCAERRHKKNVSECEMARYQEYTTLKRLTTTSSPSHYSVLAPTRPTTRPSLDHYDALIPTEELPVNKDEHITAKENQDLHTHYETQSFISE